MYLSRLVSSNSMESPEQLNAVLFKQLPRLLKRKYCYRFLSTATTAFQLTQDSSEDRFSNRFFLWIINAEQLSMNLTSAVASGGGLQSSPRGSDDRGNSRGSVVGTVTIRLGNSSTKVVSLHLLLIVKNPIFYF